MQTDDQNQDAAPFGEARGAAVTAYMEQRAQITTTLCKETSWTGHAAHRKELIEDIERIDAAVGGLLASPTESRSATSHE